MKKPDMQINVGSGRENEGFSCRGLAHVGEVELGKTELMMETEAFGWGRFGSEWSGQLLERVWR